MTDNIEQHNKLIHDILSGETPVTFSNTLDPTTIRKLNKAHDQFVCIHCNKPFNSKASLNLHLASCRKRAVLRDFQVDDQIFHVWMNPRKDIVSALIRIRDNEPKDIVLKIFVGSLTFLTYYGFVHFYLVTPFKHGVTPIKPIKEERKYQEYINEAHNQWKTGEIKRKKLHQMDAVPPTLSEI